MTDLMSKIKEDMEVYDRDGDKIGTVERVQWGADGTTPDNETDLAPDQPRGVAAPRSKAEGAAIILPTDDEIAHLPEEMRERLAMHGFVRIDSGLLHSDRLIMPEQIEDVTADRVIVNAKRDELLKI